MNATKKTVMDATEAAAGTKATRPGVITTCVLLLAAMWLFFAPFIIGYQPQGADWVTATRNDLAVGGALVAACLIGLGTMAVLTVRELRRAAQAHEDH